MGKALRKILTMGTIGLALAGCSTKIEHPARYKSGCLGGYTFSLSDPNATRIEDYNCDGKVDGIRNIPVSAGEQSSYLMIPESLKNGRKSYPFYEQGTVIMTLKMQQLADSILSQERQLAFLEDSARYWAKVKKDTTNVRRRW